jgi:hypothetical protein
MVITKIHTPFFLKALELNEYPENAVLFNDVLSLPAGISIKKAEIAQAIKKHKIFPAVLENPRDRLVASVAWLVVNPDENLMLNLKMDEQGLSLNEHNWISLKANIHREEPWLAVTFASQEELNEFKTWLIEEKKQNAQEVDKKVSAGTQYNQGLSAITISNQENQLDLDEMTQFLPDVWSNATYVFNQLEQACNLINLSAEQQEEYKKSIFNQVNDELWHDHGFATELLMNYDATIQFISDKAIKDKIFRDILVKEDLLHAWGDLYKRVYFAVCGKDSQNKYSAYSANSNWNFSEEEKKEFLQECKQWFANKKLVLNIIDSAHSYADLNEFYKDLPEALQLDEEVVCLLSTKCLNKDIKFNLNNIHQEYFRHDNFNGIIAFCLTHATKGLPEDMASKVFGSWLNDKDKVIYAIQKVYEGNKTKTPEFVNQIFSFLSEELKNDKEVIPELLSRAPKLYSQLAPYARQSTQAVNAILSRPNFTYLLDRDVKLAQTDINVIKNLLQSDISLLKDAGENWKSNPMLMASFANRLNEFIKKDWLTSEVYEHIYSSHDAVIELIAHKYDEYKNLPAHLKIKEPLVFQYIDSMTELFNTMEMRADTTVQRKELVKKHAQIRQNAIKELPQELWSRESFCVKMIGRDMQFSNAIPEPFWSQKSFLQKVASEIDRREITVAEAFLPEKITTFFTQLGAVKGKYESTFNKLMLKMKLEKNIAVVEEDSAPKLKL